MYKKEQDEADLIVRAWKMVFTILGIMGGAMTVVSIAKNGIDIDLWGTPATIYSEYKKYREFLFSIVPVDIPWYIKDIVLLYINFGLALVGSYQSTYKISEMKPRNYNPFVTWSNLLRLGLRWPIFVYRTVDIYRHLGKVERETGYTLETSRGKQLALLRRQALILLSIFVATSAYFSWNYLSR